MGWLVATMLATATARRDDRGTALEVDVHASGVGLGHVFQAELVADLLDAGLDLLDVVDGVVSLADDAARYWVSIKFSSWALLR